MKETVVDGKKIKLFDDVEELKWYYHTKLCKGDVYAEHLMNICVKEKDVNEWLECIGEPCRVKEA